jgi:nitrite reductase (NO-forming)
MRTVSRRLPLLVAPLLVATACAPTYEVVGPQAASAVGDGYQHQVAAWDRDRAPSDDWEPRDARLDPAPDTDLHELTIRASEIEKEVAPGVTQTVWTYDDLFPGPTLRGKVGDTFRITLINDGNLGHSIDFHSSKVAPNVEMRTIERGEELVYEFVAEKAGVYMYHCGTDPVLQHTGMGQHGVMIVDPPGLPEVDHEFWILQHETYMGKLNEQYEKMEAAAWDAVVFNGYPYQYVHAPLDGIEVGERVRMWVMNNGPSENTSFHVIGTIFDTVYKEGSYRLHPDRDDSGGAQVIDLKPSQGGFVEMTFDTDGIYKFVDHKFANLPKGAVGLMIVGDPDDAEHADGKGH